VSVNELRVIPLTGIPIVKEGDDIAAQIIEASAAQDLKLADGDVLSVTQRIVSRAEGRIRRLDEFEPSAFALDFADRFNKDPHVVEAVLRESTRIIRQVGGVLITETRHGLKCANAGVDASNVGGEGFVSLLPVDPDASCQRIRDGIRAQAGIEVAVIMTDTFGRPWRHGQTNVAIGLAGMLPFRDYVGERDMDGRELHVTTICVVDGDRRHV
jgi:coenzyme F420-0:L-glutamate ligase/coenzyme F420-1:gamma-L-glutamate ligase